MVFTVRRAYSAESAIALPQFESTKAYMGWHGVGMSMAAKAVAKAAQESRDHFDVVVLVTAGEKCSSSPRKLQRRIAEQLRLIDVGQKERNDDDVEEEEEEDKHIDKELARMINGSLTGGRKFLLIIDNLVQAHGIGNELDLGLMGVPTILEWNESKIFITTPHFQVIRVMHVPSICILRAPLESESNVLGDLARSVEELDLLGVDGLLAHFHDDAGDVANTMGIDHEVEQVFSCFIYLCLFQQTTSTSMDVKELMKYYVGEGFITTHKPDGIDDLEGAFRHGEAVLGEMVTRYMVEGDGKRISLNSHLWKILDGHEEGRRYLKEKLHIHLEGNMLKDDAAARWVSLSHNKIQPFIPITSRLMPSDTHRLSTLLLNDNPELQQIPDTFFHQIPNLKVLDLSRTSISSFPPSLSSLVHLRFLKLQECPYLNTLPPSLKHLKQLIILDLRGTPLILSDSTPSEALEQKTDLRLIDLSHTNITHSLLPSLLSSLCNLNLERLLLAGCNAFGGPPLLMSMPSPPHHQLIGRLSELDISSCCGALKDVENVSFQDLPKLRALDLSHTPVARLSITRCASLEMVRLQGLTNLKSLHLSRIKIKEFPHEISELTLLQELHLSDVKQLRRVDWEKVQWLPEKLEWDQCSCCSGCSSSSRTALLEEQLAESSSSRSGGGGVAFISVNHASIFQGLGLSSPLWKQCFSKFHFFLSPCRNRHREQYQKKSSSSSRRRKQPAGIYSKIFNLHLHLPDHTLLMGRRRSDFSRHLEIEGAVSSLFRGCGDRRRSLLEAVARRAKVLWLRENGESVKSLADLEVEEMEDLEECWVERCHNMQHLFPYSYWHWSRDIQGPSQRLWVSDLGSLKCVNDRSGDFRSLKHLHIQCCPQLVTLFAYQTTLPQLETLRIRFCARLESVCRESIFQADRAFPNLHALQLWELPKLKHICKGSLLSLRRLRVRACPRLQQLPDLDPQKVMIEGETDWWTNHRWHNQIMANKEAAMIILQRKGGPPF